MTTPTASALLRDRLLTAIARITGPDWHRRLDALNADAIRAYGSGALHEPDAERVFRAVQDRRDRMAAAAGLHRAKARAGQGRGQGNGHDTPLGAFAFDRLADLRPVVPRREDAPPRAPRPRTTHAERAERPPASRRRSYLGHRLPWPATIKQDFHPAELGAVGVIVREIRAHGTCELALGTIAARARCCRRTVQTAIRWAAHRGYLSIEERAKGTHVIRIASAALSEWADGRRPPEPEKSKQQENLNGPAKVATGSRPAGACEAEGSPATNLPDDPAEASGPTRREGAPTTPSRLDAVIAAWRGVLVARGETVETPGAARPAPVPIPRPG